MSQDDGLLYAESCLCKFRDVVCGVLIGIGVILFTGAAIWLSSHMAKNDISQDAIDLVTAILVLMIVFGVVVSQWPRIRAGLFPTEEETAAKKEAKRKQAQEDVEAMLAKARKPK